MAPKILANLPNQSIARPQGSKCQCRQLLISSNKDYGGRLVRSQAISFGHETSTGLFSAHPDAVRRRQQALARKAAANLEKQNAQNPEWWKATLPSNLVTASDPDSFQAALATDKLVVVDFFAPWCMACRRLFPALVKLAENNPDIQFVKVNGGDTLLSKFVESLAVDKLPYFHFYRGGELISHFAANLTKISMLRAEIAAQKECVLSAILDSPFLASESSSEGIQSSDN